MKITYFQCLYILGQISNNTNYCPHFQETKCILEKIEAHVYLRKHQGIKCSEKCLSIVIHRRVVCKFSIVLNWNAVHCCACRGINFYYAEKSIIKDPPPPPPKEISNVQHLLSRLYMRDFNSSKSQIISL